MRAEFAEGLAAAPDSVIAAIAEDLELFGVPLCQEFAEMVYVARAENPRACAPSSAAADVLSEEPTPAERSAAEVLYALATLARRVDLDDAALRTLAGRVAFYLARFETYLAERDARDGLIDLT
ncbi:MAG TPA: hypothetical protein VFR41_15765 [Acidimicrobiia bacterium]|nr:hypothetical protein [Acidimicrobiia bacterium]